MEKRLFVAVLLSFVILYIWSLANPPQKLSNLSADITQTNEVKQLTLKQADSTLSNDFQNQEILPQEDSSEESTNFIENDKLVVEFSNLGGVIKEIRLKSFDEVLPVGKIIGIEGYEDFTFDLEDRTDSRITYSYENDLFKISKTYQLSNMEYSLQADIIFQNKTSVSKLKNFKINSFTLDSIRLDKSDGDEARDKRLNEYVIYSHDGIKRKGSAFKFSEKDRGGEDGGVYWTAFRNRYYSLIVSPQFDVKRYFVDPIDKDLLKLGVETEEVDIPQGGSVSFSSIIYAGPEILDILKKFGLGFEKVKKFYRFAILDVIALVIYYLMHTIHNFLPNWGVCIILISVIIYFSMYPLTLRGMASMKKMQALQPKLAKLKEKHKDNPKKLQTEMMQIYKTERINPLGGCLPFLFQMPVFIGLYQVLWRDVSFKGSGFLWIKDLSSPDRLFTFSTKIPFIGNDFNILPIVMMVIMFFQTKLQAKNMVATSPAQIQQQKMMGKIMPIFLGVIFYKFASGLTLYFTMFYMFSTFTQWKMSKEKKVA